MVYSGIGWPIRPSSRMGGQSAVFYLPSPFPAVRGGGEMTETDHRTDAEAAAGITIEIARSLWIYCAATGSIIRRIDSKRRRTGSALGARGDRYRHYVYGQRRLSQHRLAWALFYGEWPDRPIDHINLNGFDNRIENLRLASVAENQWNRPPQSRNKLGMKGVVFDGQRGKYRARMRRHGVDHYLGHFDTAEEAQEAYKAAAVSHDGPFARVAPRTGSDAPAATGGVGP